IGLSATQRPLDEVARYLGGRSFDGTTYTPRPVTVVDGGLRKALDLGIVSPAEAFGPLPEKTVWPSIYRLLASLIREHTSTLVFANDRRSVERITACLNEEQDGAVGASPTREVAVSKSELARAHHGSVSLELRHEIEA